MANKNSHIVAVTTEAAKLVTQGIQNGFIPFDPETTTSLPFQTNEIFVAPRDLLEVDENFKQVIPYVVVTRDDKFLTYRRTNKSGEGRLHEKLSIGFGGHIDIGDVVSKNDGQAIDLEATVAVAVDRELEEELKGEINSDIMPLGIILDESDEVGRVHLGIVLTVAANGIVLANEDQIELLGFKTAEELAKIDNDTSDNTSLESWTKIVINFVLANRDGE